ncbi:MAG: PPOX class F420-dependent oxidoreductase [Mycetocola sp.]
MPPAAPLHELADERFVLLTTFRRSGEPVNTPVWIASDDDGLMVTTPKTSGKVRRLRHDDRIELRPCSRMGRVDDDAHAIRATATIVDDDASRGILTRVFSRKYGLEYRVFLFIERLSRSGRQDRVMLRLTSA